MIRIANLENELSRERMTRVDADEMLRQVQMVSVETELVAWIVKEYGVPETEVAEQRERLEQMLAAEGTLT